MKQKMQNLKVMLSKIDLKKSVFFLSFLIVLNSCTTVQTDLRTLAPKETLIYLETNDLGKALNALTENQAFKENSSIKPDFSAFDDMQMAVAITGFATSENQVTDEQSVLNFKPKFTAIAETHAWSWQVNSLVEKNLNDFVKKNYGGQAKLERKSVNETERFTWTANDGRKTFAVVSGTQVFFGNDEESVYKCLSAKRGETENLLKNENLSAEYENAKGKLAFGFISNQGVKQIAEIVGVTVAVGQSEDENARGFIANILPQILNKSVKEITWTTNKTERGIEDEIFIKTEKEVADVLSETLVSSNQNSNEFYNFLPLETFSVTRYNLKNPQIAFRSLLLTTAKQTDVINGKIIAAFSNSLLSSYGIADAEGFLSAVDSEILTARLDENGDKKISLVKVKDFEKLKQTFREDVNFSQTNEKESDVEIWNSTDESFSVVLVKDVLIFGDAESVKKTLEIHRKRQISPIETEKDFTKNNLFSSLKKSKATSSTFTKDFETSEKVINVLGKVKESQQATYSNSLVETNFTKRGIERKYVSDFGFLGTIVEQFGEK